jgi:hypothetical protein
MGEWLTCLEPCYLLEVEIVLCFVPGVSKAVGGTVCRLEAISAIGEDACRSTCTYGVAWVLP